MIRNDEKLFKELNEELKKIDTHLTITCVGGYVLNQHNIRATQDIDSFYDTNKQIEDIIAKIGEKHHANSEDELWLNNSVQNMNKKPPQDICSVKYGFSNLTVQTPPLDYIAGMKLFAGREQDLADVAAIIKHLEIKDPDKLESKLVQYKFGEIDESLVLEAFGTAYGMDWLEKYYIENEPKIIEKSSIGLSQYYKEHPILVSQEDKVQKTSKTDKPDILETYKKTPMYQALVELNDVLKEKGLEHIHLDVVGGFAMIANGCKDSYYTDIDYVGKSIDMPKECDDIGIKHGLGAGWLNNDLMLAGTTKEELEFATGQLHFYPLFDLGKIDVSVLDAKDLLRMKVLSVDTSLAAIELGGDFTRAKDLPDISALMERRNMDILALEMETFMICDISDKTYDVINDFNKTKDLGAIVQKIEEEFKPPLSNDIRKNDPR